MTEATWQAFYASELQGLYALLVVPLAFLAYRLTAPTDGTRAVVPEAAGFVSSLTLIFAFETMLDPIATGPIVRSDWISGHPAAPAIPFLFVLLGDLRVLLLAIGVATPERTLARKLGWALSVSLVVPVATGLVYGIVGWIWPEIHGQLLWILYELFFLTLCVYFGRVWIPRQLGAQTPAAGYLRAVFGYSAAYYALWLAADLLIVVGGLDLGWAIRIVPNQLYYAFWVPFVYARFFSLPGSNAER